MHVMTSKVALSFVNKLREFESVLQSQKTNNIKSQSILPEYKTFKQKESFIDSFSSENSFCLMQLGFDFSTTFSSNIIQLDEDISQRIGKEVKCRPTQHFLNELTAIINIVDAIIDLLHIKDVLPIISCLLDVLISLPSKFKDKQFDLIINKICDKDKELKFIQYEIYMKIWKLDPSFLEKDVLVLINECSQCLPLPSILQDLILPTYLVRSCSEDYMVYKFVYEIIQTILLQSEKNPIFLQFTTTFLSSVHLLQQQKQLVSYCIYPKEFQHLKLLLNQDSKTICLSSMCQQTETIVNEIKSLVISENNVTKLDLMLLLTQHVHWYYNIIWNIFNSSQKFNGILVEYLLWFHNIYTDNFKRRVVECIENMKCILKKKSLRESDTEYGVYGIVSIEELLPLTKHLLFILLLQSDSGFLLSNQIFHMARCDTDQDILMMFIYLHDIHPINISVWSSTKLIAFQNICQTSRCNIEKNQQIDINHHHTILHKSENLFS